MREKATGLDLLVYPAKASYSYSLGGRSGRSILAFQAKSAGVHQFNSSYSGTAGPSVVLAIGKGMAEGLLFTIAISIAALLGSILLAAIVAYYTYRRRKKAFQKREDDAELMRGGG